MQLTRAELDSIHRVLAVLEEEATTSLPGSRVGRMWAWASNDLRERLGGELTLKRNAALEPNAAEVA